MYVVTNTTTFFVVCLLLLRYNYMFRPSMLAIFRLYMRNLSISYTNVCGECMFTITRHNYMFRPSMLAIFRLYMRNLSRAIQTCVGNLQIVGWGGARSRFVLEKRASSLSYFSCFSEIPERKLCLWTQISHVRPGIIRSIIILSPWLHVEWEDLCPDCFAYPLLPQ